MLTRNRRGLIGDRGERDFEACRAAIAVAKAIWPLASPFNKSTSAEGGAWEARRASILHHAVSARGVIFLINGVSNASNSAAAKVMPEKIPKARVSTSGVPCSNS